MKDQDNENTVSEEEWDVDSMSEEEFEDACALLIRGLYKTCSDEAGGDEAVARELFKRRVVKDQDFLYLILGAEPHFESLAKMDNCESFQIVQELIDRLLKPGGDIESIKEQIISLSAKNPRLDKALENITKIGKRSIRVPDENDTSH